MIEKEDYIYIPKMQFVDVVDNGLGYYGSAIMTRRYMFLLVDTIDSVEEKKNYKCYNVDFIEKFLANPQDINISIFETEMLTYLNELHIFPFADLKKFEVTVGFSIFGGIKIVKHNKKMTSMSIQNKKVRQNIKDFYIKYIK